jgi:hypothetical protein
MALLLPISSPGFRWNFCNQTTPTTSPGTNVTPGASNAEGAWTSICTGAQLVHDCYTILFYVNSGFTAAASKMHLLDIGADPAGGTSYTALVENIQVGSSGSGAAVGLYFCVPIFIPKASQVAVRIQGQNATAGTVRVMATLLGRPVRPEFAQKLQSAETVGTITTSRGVVVTPGLSGAEGAWTLIGATTFPWRYCLPTLQIDDATASAQAIWLDAAYGDATNKVIVAEHINYLNPSTSEQMSGGPGLNPPDLWCDIPTGTNIYARLSTSIATADSNYAVLVTGLG